MSAAPRKTATKPTANRRDYDRRKKRGPMRKTGRPLWRQPLLLGIAVLLLGCGGGGGWWAWREGWLVEVQSRIDAVSRSVVGAITPFKLADVTVEGRDYVERSAILAALNVTPGDSLLGVDLQASRQRLEAIDWVAGATVERRLPDTLYVVLRERRAVALWQNGTEYTLIDRNGRTVKASRMPPTSKRRPVACSTASTIRGRSASASRSSSAAPRPSAGRPSTAARRRNSQRRREGAVMELC